MYIRERLIMSKHSVISVLDALAEQTKTRGGSPSVQEILDAKKAVTDMIEAYAGLRANLKHGGNTYELDDSMRKMDEAVANAKGREIKPICGM